MEDVIRLSELCDGLVMIDREKKENEQGFFSYDLPCCVFLSDGIFGLAI